MYEKDGEKYFVFDSHLHFWDASPENWVKGQEEYAKGWIECFHAYHGPRPGRDALDARALPEVLGRGLREGRLRGRPRRQGRLPVDVPEGVVHERLQRHRAERRAARPLPGQAASSTAAGTRARARPACEQLEADHAQVRHPGREALHGRVDKAPRAAGSSPTPRRSRSSTSASSSGSRTSTSTRARRSGRWTRTPSTSPTSTTSRPTTTELNFIVEHVGLPRIEDFCFMATQEPNVYAGLAVVVGGLMHARPQFFAKVMGELLFWVGEDKMLFGSDYAIWEPKWQVEGLVDWEMPGRATSSPTTRGSTTTAKKKILGLNAAKLYGVDVPAGVPAARRGGTPAAPRRRAAGRGRRVSLEVARPRGAGHGLRPGARRADHRARLRRLLRRDRRTGTSRVRLRLPTPQCAPNFAYLMAADARAAVRRLPEVREVTVVLEDHYTGDGDQRGARRAASEFADGVPRRDRGRRSTRCASCSSARRCSPARRGCARRCSPTARRPRRSSRCASRTCRTRRTRVRCRGAARRARPAARRRRARARRRRRRRR